MYSAKKRGSVIVVMGSGRKYERVPTTRVNCSDLRVETIVLVHERIFYEMTVYCRVPENRSLKIRRDCLRGYRYVREAVGDSNARLAHALARRIRRAGKILLNLSFNEKKT